jgi:hypothetical protein
VLLGPAVTPRRTRVTRIGMHPNPEDGSLEMSVDRSVNPPRQAGTPRRRLDPRQTGDPEQFGMVEVPRVTGVVTGLVTGPPAVSGPNTPEVRAFWLVRQPGNRGREVRGVLRRCALPLTLTVAPPAAGSPLSSGGWVSTERFGPPGQRHGEALSRDRNGPKSSGPNHLIIGPLDERYRAVRLIVHPRQPQPRSLRSARPQSTPTGATGGKA